MKIEAEDNHEILWSRAIGGPRTGKQKASILLDKGKDQWFAPPKIVSACLNNFSVKTRLLRSS